MMSMSFAADGLGSADASKSAFLELGHGIPASQQHFSALPTNVYPTHGLHSGGHPQHESPFPSGACHYGGPLGYSYPAPLNAPAPAPTYLPYQQGSYRNPLSHTRNEETGECPLSPGIKSRRKKWKSKHQPVIITSADPELGSLRLLLRQSRDT